MKVYYVNFNYVIKKAITGLLIIFALILAYKMIQYNLLKPTLTKFEPIYQGSAEQKKIAFTCNVVWGEEHVPRILEILKKNDVRMTFYLGGQWVQKFPDLAKQIAGNHEVGNHSFSHPHPTFISKRENIIEIKKTEQAVYEQTAVKTRLYAPPYGEFNKTVLEAAGENGYQTILWSIDTLDWKRPSPDIIVRRVTDKAHNGAIVLMHPTEPTVNALPVLIEKLREKGYELTTVSDIIGLK